MFEKVRFHGEFLDYQRRVLENADRYLADGKLNIVAAPGSGKTVLGLELIRRIGKPCLIFSPTTAIREQWGERFRELFLEDKADFDTLFSVDLRHIKTVNSVTYQALFTAMEKVKEAEEGDDAYPDVDILGEIREGRIGTICLDEAHHLKNEWQRALEKLLGAVGESVTVISLTATPPYDSESHEWKRYLAMCGEVDEEIFVPELVARDTLCPHQDYVYFNYPTKDEIAVLSRYREEAKGALDEIGRLDFMYSLCKSINAEGDYDTLYGNAKSYIALLVLFRKWGFDINQKTARALCGKRGLPFFGMSFAQSAVSFLLSGELLDEGQKGSLIDILKAHGVYHKRKVELVLNERLKRTLVSSAGKLSSIAEIAKSEYASMGQKLRMLILTDYIKKESVMQAAECESFHDISVVSIFECVRRACGEVNIGVLSGSLVILPHDLDPEDVHFVRRNIRGTRYDVVDMSGSTHDAVRAVGALFEKGDIGILIGTKSLLGEGWDAPCVNSLIMASFVGSFVLSNQMRGRAIRIDKSDPQKTANIWHLVTVEPPYLFAENAADGVKKILNYDKNELESYDYDILKRRFDAFLAPSYRNASIESGIERITAISPPYDEDGIARINRDMLALAADRASVREKWMAEVKGGGFEVALETRIDSEKRVPVFIFKNMMLVILMSALGATVLREFISSILNIGLLPPSMWLGFLAGEALFCYLTYRFLKKLFLHLTPSRSFKTLGLAVYRTMHDCGLLAPCSKVESVKDKNLRCVCLYLRNASIHDQNRFNTAMAELLSPIENPRYLLIRKKRLGGYDYRTSLACPSAIGKKKEYVEILAKHLKAGTGRFEAVYTGNESGRALILKCRRRSYITLNMKQINPKFKVRRWE